MSTRPYGGHTFALLEMQNNTRNNNLLIELQSSNTKEMRSSNLLKFVKKTNFSQSFEQFYTVISKTFVIASKSPAEFFGFG